MAKIRRVIRKVHKTGGEYFDEQLWPIYIALVVLGAFLMGLSAAYLPFSGVPWYASAWTSLVSIPLVVGGFMLAFRLVDNRLVRRSMQLSVVVCSILHILLVVQMIQTHIFAKRLAVSKADKEFVERRPQKLIPEYHPSQMLPAEDRPRQDFEKPVEVKTPDPLPEPDQVVKQVRPEEPKSPPEPQPVPVPEPQPTPEPNVIKKPQPNEAAPRQAEQASKLSRQVKPSDVKTSQLVQTPTVTPAPAAGVEAKASTATVERKTAEPTAVARPSPTEPTTTSDAANPQVAKRTPTNSPTPEVSATPTLKRQVAQPTATPRAQVAAADTPSPAKQTTPTEVTPANTTSIKRATTSPEVARTSTEPTPEATRDPAATPQRREHPAEAQPTAVAQTPSPVPNRQPRSTTRPDVATTAAAATPTAAPSPSSTASAEPTPQTTQLKRAATQVTSAQPSALPSAEPRSAMREQPAAQVARAAGRDSPTATANPTATPTLTRQTTAAPSLAAATQTAQSAAGTVAAPTSSSEVSPTSVATRRQATASPQAAKSTGEPTPAQIASAATQPSDSPTPVRRTATTGQSASDSPVVASQAGSVATTSRSTTTSVTNVVTTVGDVAANAGPQTAANANPGPSSATISRQTAANASGATRTQPSLSAPSASPSSQLARGGAQRAVTNPSPTIDPSSTATGTPQRAIAQAQAATSPTSVESPSTAIAASGAGEPSAQPTRMALSRSQAGTAGAGRSPNVDSSLPGGNSPALAASGAARRAEATRNTNAGDALSPSSPSQLARSRAGAEVPSSTIQAQAVDVATVGGGEQVADVTASASAALTRADASAKVGAVNASKGSGEVDLGPTQVVAEAGVGRASGGGQPELNFETQSPQLARAQQSGGAPLMALAGAQVGEVAAPMGTAGGQPAASEPGPSALSAVRTVAGGEASASGGPSAAKETGPLAEANTSALVAETALSRADAAEGRSGGEAAAGDPGLEDEEEKARRLARAAAGGGPQLAIAGPVVAAAAESPMGQTGDGGTPGASPDVTATAIATARQSRDGGAPAGGTPLSAGDPGESGGQAGAEAVGTVAVARAEATDGATGEPVIGGGTGAPARAAQGATFASNVTAETISVAGAPESGGSPSGAPLEATGLVAARAAGGAAGPATTGPVGAVAGPEVVDASAPGAAGDAPGRRQGSPSQDNGPAVDAIASTGAPGKRAAATALAGGATTVADIPEVGPTSAVAQAEIDHILGGVGNTPMSRQTGEALAVNVEAPEGPGGIGADFSPEVGLNTRQARQESLQVHLRSARFVKNTAGGVPSTSTTAIASTTAFSSRGARKTGDEPAGGKGTPPPQTEEAIEMGLAFLARYQMTDGGWSLQSFPENAGLATDTAATALAVLAFQGAGYNHREHQYKDVVRGGIDFLVKSQKENGDLFVPLDDNSNRSVWLYSHSLAAIALCEAYGMTQDPALKEPAQKALDFILAAQHAERGGWRYSPGVGTDTSVTGWMMMALKSGELANLNVPKDTYAKIDKWLDLAQQSPAEPHLYRYNPYAPDTEEQKHGRSASKTMTAVGLLMRLYTGWKRDNPNLAKGADYLKENLPAIGTPREPQRDTYYWYYGTQVMFHMGGEHWQAWNSRLHPLIVNGQTKAGPLAGSWDPRGAVPDRWGPHGGRLYVTALNLLSLEVYYRHLPLYEDTAK
ncbi:MAG: hypothetical protein SFU86_04050 [Pirellulaceae bacterium]|nr:hypothetical protein [Pirellulaceae bacterium]